MGWGERRGVGKRRRALYGRRRDVRDKETSQGRAFMAVPPKRTRARASMLGPADRVTATPRSVGVSVRFEWVGDVGEQCRGGRVRYLRPTYGTAPPI